MVQARHLKSEVKFTFWKGESKVIHASEVNQQKHCLVDMCAMIAVPKLLGLNMM